MTAGDMAMIHAAAFAGAARPWSAAEIHGLLAARGVFVVTSGDGFALGRLIADEVELLTIAVHPQAQGSGQGRALLQRFETTGTTRGGATAFLEVAADNASAIRLYTRAGYQITGQRKGYYRHGDRVVDAQLMAKALVASSAATI